MSAYNHTNLCVTLENRSIYEVRTLPCAKPHMKTSELYHRLAAEDDDESHIWDTCHQWPNGDRKHGRCINCGKTLKEVTQRIRINPKTGEPVRRSRLARAIAMTAADVPPVLFVGAMR